MLDYKSILSIIAILIATGSRIEYIYLIVRGKIKPHAFSWLVWSVLTGIAFAAQVSEKGGAGSWLTGFTALTCFMVFLLALAYGQRKFSLIDWVSLTGSGVALALWWFTKNPLGAVILVSIIDILGMIPTFIKGYKKPFEDSINIFWIANVTFTLSLFALETHSLTTWLYPLTVIATNTAFVVMVVIRRQKT